MWTGFYKRGGFYKVLDAPTTNWTPLYPVFTTLSKGLKIHDSGNASDRPLKAHWSSQCAAGANLVIVQQASPLRKNRRRGLSAVLQYFLFYSKRKKEASLPWTPPHRKFTLEKMLLTVFRECFWATVKAFSQRRFPKGNRSSSDRQLSTASFPLFILFRPPKITENQSLRGIDESEINDILFWLRLA